MRNVEIWMEGQMLDINAGLSAQVTYAVDDIKEFGAKNTAFSKTIEIPGSANNNRLFGFVFEFGLQNFEHDFGAPNLGANFNPGVHADVVIFIDSIQVVKGVLRLMEIKKDGGAIIYECYVTGELGGLISAIGPKKLRGNKDNPANDIRLGHNHAWTFSNITGSFAGVGTGSGYAYPLVDYGLVGDPTKHDFDIRAFRPACYVREVVDKIITNAGYTWESAFFDTAFFKRLIIPNQDDAFYIDTTEVAYAVNNLTTFLMSGSGPLGTTFVPFSPTSSKLHNATLTTTTVTNDTLNYTGASTTGKVKASLNFKYSNVYTNPVTMTAELRRNGVLVDFQTVTLATVSSGFAYGQLNLNFAGGSTALTSGDSYRLDIYTTTASGGTGTYEIRTTQYDTYISIIADIEQRALALIGDSVSPDLAIPKDITQKDFFSTILKMFNLYVQEDREKRKHLHIIPYRDFYNTDPTTFIDWTAKYDANGKSSLKPMSELNARYYNFLYEKDSDYWNEYYFNKYQETYGSRYVDTGFEFADNAKEVKLPFAGSPIRKGTDKYFPAIYKLDSSNNEQATGSKPRILQVSYLSGLSSYNIKNGATVLGSATSYAHAGHFDHPLLPAVDLNFGALKEILYPYSYAGLVQSLFNYYYSSYMAEIVSKDSKLLTASFNLNVGDIYNLDFSRFIMLDGTLWRLNKVKDFEVGEAKTTEVELLKVIELIY